MMYTFRFIIRCAGILLLCAAWSPLMAQQDTVSSPDAPAAERITVELMPDDQTPQELWDAANTAYINADYHAAIETYEQILSRGLSSAKLYYNLANAYFKEDNLGKATLYYNRAMRITPGNEDVRYNLGVAEARAKDNIERIPEFFATSWLRSLRHTMGCTAWSILSLVMLSVTLGLLLIYLLARRIAWRKAGFYGTLTALVLCVTTTWFAVVERRDILRGDQAVIMVSSTSIKSSPDNASTDLFLLHEGTKVVISDRLNGWCEITIADGKKGWIECRKIEVI